MDRRGALDRGLAQMAAGRVAAIGALGMAPEAAWVAVARPVAGKPRGIGVPTPTRESGVPMAGVIPIGIPVHRRGGAMGDDMGIPVAPISGLLGVGMGWCMAFRLRP